MGRIDYETETLITHALRADGLVDISPTLRAGGNKTGGIRPPGTDVDTCETLIPVAIPILEAGARTGKSTTDPRAGMGVGNDGDPMFTLQSGKQHAVVVSSTGDGYWNESEVIGTLRSRAQESHEHLIAFSCKDSGGDVGEISPTLRAMEFDGSHANGGGQVAVAFRAAGQEGFLPSEISPPVAASDGGGSGVPSVLAFNLRGREGGAMPEVSDVASLRSASGGSSRSYLAGDSGWAVRRLTPIETARLQGFGDTYCHIPRRPRQIDIEEAAHYLGYGIECWLEGEQWWTKVAADGSIYKAHGNSMATHVMRWLGMRIKASLGEVLIG